jgi:gliding-associated putative ABC transporter substrate-binding component GldG
MVRKSGQKRTAFIQTLIVIAIVIVVNLIGRNLYSYLDLTEDKLFSLTPSTEKLLGSIDEVIYIDVLLGGDLPSGFKQLESRTQEVIRQLRNANPQLEYRFRDVGAGTVEEINRIRENLSKDGILPMTLFVMEEDQKVEKLIYPYAIIRRGSRQITINLLASREQTDSQEMMINKSANLLEYKFANAIENLFRTSNPYVLFTTGNGELDHTQTATIEQEVSTTVRTGRINLDSVVQIDSKVDVLVVAGPTKKVSERNQFIIDQYLMNGGQVIWLVESLIVNLDSINRNGLYVPKPNEHGLDDMFFKYGVRINQDLVLDLENSKIPQVVGQAGGQAQQQLFDWVYYPILRPGSNNPIVDKIDPSYSEFPSSITLLDRPSLRQTPLLTTSEYSRRQVYPMRLTFDVVRVEQRTSAYNKSNIPVAVLVEGEFESFFKNRVSESMEKGLKSIDAEFKEKSAPTKQIFISDVDIIKNLFNPSTGKITPMGFNMWEGFVYQGNGEFAVNSLDYLTDEYGLLESRSKTSEIRLLDQVKLNQSYLKWQLINILLPILLVVLFGLVYNFIRKKRFAT